jgi:RNA polymerase sigma-70 factor, ECF subfamily
VTPDFESLIATHSAAVLAYLWRLLQDEADAEDCLQETFLRAFRAYPRLRAAGHSNPTAWLYRIATNTARTHQRRRARAASRTSALDPELAAGGDGTAALAEQRQTLQAVAAAVERLPHQQRAALMLRKYQDLSYVEIATALDCTEAAARANVYQALKSLRQALAEKSDDPPQSQRAGGRRTKDEGRGSDEPNKQHRSPAVATGQATGGRPTTD